jgi:hypothetical protein
MAVYTTYAVDHRTRTMKLVDQYDAPWVRAKEMVHGGTPRFYELVNRGYKVENPHLHKAPHLGLHQVAMMTVPGYGLAHVIAQETKRRNPDGESVHRITGVGRAAKDIGIGLAKMGLETGGLIGRAASAAKRGAIGAARVGYKVAKAAGRGARGFKKGYEGADPDDYAAEAARWARQAREAAGGIRRPAQVALKPTYKSIAKGKGR